ncbi:MAG: DUF3450 domain-containing protein [Kordiimonadaceae bacterium]|jgi:hypothetical protein|nr:DUF3450 domain-containing protein [Kordiimonadaceae bacterium]MBT6037212.1 DUF3450 domain-containing protein [Kordiimonadaceae bacterium]MBT6328673.1 DUF3450 domain-containing protein [Kordiimonadaceae bacterium]MBT7583422.1 DUF3450 domain-containing protein [Kordiimonadaceae bacterium]
MIKHRVRTVVLSAFVAAGSLSIGTAAIGQTALSDILDEGISANVIAQESQERVDAIVDDTDKIITEYKNVLKTVDGLKVYNAQMDRSVERQMQAMEELTENIKNVTNIKRQVEPLLVRMVDGLEQFINNDIPFQMETRLAGLDRVKDLMTDPDVDASERFRSVFELYQIESDYGGVFQSYQQTMDINGVERFVDMLMVGRVALLYQTTDGLVSGAYNKETRAFEVVDEATYQRSMSIAIRMANGKAPQNTLLLLPIIAPTKGTAQ